MLKKRQMNILDILNDKDDWFTGKLLAQMLNVSDRTIRSDIEAINKEYQGQVIVANKRWGYKLNQQAAAQMDWDSHPIIPQTPQERVVWMLKELLFNSKEINLFDLENRVFVSGYSIENDLQSVKKVIKDYQLQLKRSKNFIQLEGDENEKRRLYRKLLTDEVQGNFTNLGNLSALFDNIDFLRLADIFTETCQKCHYQIKESLLPIVMIHAGVAVERMLSKNYVAAPASLQEGFRDTAEYRLAAEFFASLSAAYPISRSESELVRFALLLNSCTNHEHLAQEDEMNELVKLVLLKLAEHFAIDFAEDEVLAAGLANHFSSLVERQRTHTNMSNIYLKDIKRKYPLIFEMAVHVGEVLSAKLGEKVDENELSFIALHLGAAYDRINSPSKYRAVVIIPHNQLLAKPFMDKLHLRFAERMTIVFHYKLFDERQIHALAPDLIISTVALKHRLPIPTLQLSLLFDYEDESKIFQLLNRLDTERYHEKFQMMMEDLIQKKLFYRKKSVRNREEAIEFLCNQLIEQDLADEAYKQDVLRREEISATSFLQGFAVPHAIDQSARESCIATLTLENPIQWGNFEVRLVILLAIREVDTQLMRIFFDWLSSLVMDPQKLSLLIQAKDQQEFIGYLF